jgi:hypothetical protein
MRLKRRIPYSWLSLPVALFFLAVGVLAAQDSTPNKEQKEDEAGFKEFSDRVQDYVKLQKTIESSLPAMNSTDLPEMIAAHQQALARKIREARPKAKAGDIFTHPAREAFRHVIRSVFLGPDGDNARATMQQGATVKELPLVVNGIYPDAAPYTTVPPTLLAAFPKLPEEVAYRIVSRNLVLIDVKSNMVIDLVHDLIPSKP